MKVKGKVKILRSGSAPQKSLKYLYLEEMQFLDKAQQKFTISNFNPLSAEDSHISDDVGGTVDTNEDGEMRDDISVVPDATREELSGPSQVKGVTATTSRPACREWSP